MERNRREEITSKAKEINDLSEQFQLVHATYAVQEYIKQIAKDFYQQQLDRLKTSIKQKMENESDTSKELEEKKELEEVIKRKRFSVDVGYIDIRNEDIARVVKVDNSFVIYLAASLRDSIVNDKGRYDYKVIQKIRKLMSHELGHLVLHTKDLLAEDGLRGSMEIKSSDKEEEAEVFGTELIELRKERNRKIREDGGADNLF